MSDWPELPALLSDRGPCSDCGASMAQCYYADPTSVCCQTCIHHAATTDGVSS